MKVLSEVPFDDLLAPKESLPRTGSNGGTAQPDADKLPGAVNTSTPELMATMMETGPETRPVSITTIRLAEAGMRQMMEGVRPWAQMPNEHRARQILAKMQAALDELQAVLASW